jgi:hypothetical protein
MPYRKDGNRMGDEGKAVGIAQAPAALLSDCCPLQVNLQFGAQNFRLPNSGPP